MEKRMDKAILYTTQMTKKADIITRDHSTTDFGTEKVMKLSYLHMYVKYPFGNTILAFFIYFISNERYHHL